MFDLYVFEFTHPRCVFSTCFALTNVDVLVLGLSERSASTTLGQSSASRINFRLCASLRCLGIPCNTYIGPCLNTASHWSGVREG